MCCRPAGCRYYETIGLIDAAHPQTILAYDMNGKTLTVSHRAPPRLGRRLGYKMAHAIICLELVQSLAQLRAAAAPVGKIAVMRGTRGSEALPLVQSVKSRATVTLSRKPSIALILLAKAVTDGAVFCVQP